MPRYTIEGNTTRKKLPKPLAPVAFVEQNPFTPNNNSEKQNPWHVIKFCNPIGNSSTLI